MAIACVGKTPGLLDAQTIGGTHCKTAIVHPRFA